MKKKAKVILGIVVLCVVGGLGMFFILGKNKTTSSNVETTEKVEKRNSQFLMATGTTSAKTEYVYFPLSFDVPLEIEKVYVESGSEVTTNSAIVKMTDESYQWMKQTLEETLNSTKADLTQAKLEYQTEILALQSECNSNIAITDTAYEQYETTLEQLDMQKSVAKKQYEDTKKIVTNYPGQIQKKKETVSALRKKVKKVNNELSTLKTQQQKKQQIYDDAASTYENAQATSGNLDAVQEYIRQYLSKNGRNISAQQVEDNSLLAFQSQLTQDQETAGQTLQEAKQNYESAQAKLEMVSEKIEKKEQKKESWKEKIATLQKKIADQQSQLSEGKQSIAYLKNVYEQAKVEEETERISAEQQLQQDLLAKDLGEVSYGTQKESLQNSLAEAKEAYQEALEQWQTFEKECSDGVWCAKREGTLSYVGCEEGGLLVSQLPLIGYQDDSGVSVSVTVDQSDRSSVSVGDQVSIMSASAGPGAKGFVKKIGSSPSATSASSTTYEVTIEIDTAEHRIGAGETVQVMFGDQKEEIRAGGQ